MLPQPLFSLSRVFLLFALISATVLSSGCAVGSLFSADQRVPTPSPKDGVKQSVEKAKLFGIIPIYRADVQQGNFISKEMVAQLKIGMTPDQVRFILGTPLLNDVFHQERWDYPFRIKGGDGTITSSQVTIFFKNGKLERFEGGDLPDEKDYLQRIAAPK